MMHKQLLYSFQMGTQYFLSKCFVYHEYLWYFDLDTNCSIPHKNGCSQWSTRVYYSWETALIMSSDNMRDWKAVWEIEEEVIGTVACTTDE
jgi:hypothetical protein